MGEAKKMNVDLIPSILQLEGAPILARDPSLVESIPYRHERFVVTGGMLKSAESPLPIVNGGFEAFTGELPTGFKGVHKDDLALFQDKAMKHAGVSSLRVEGKKPGATMTFTQSLVVEPWHHYRLAIWSQTADPQGTTIPSSLQMNVLSSANVSIGDPQWRPTAAWAMSSTAFNSQDDITVTLSLTISPAVNGKIWVDDLTIADIGLVNVTRRPDCPLLARGDDGVIYNEGVNFARIKDPYLAPGFGPGHFDVTHDLPPLPLTPVTRLQEGQAVNIDFYAAELRDGQPSICINERKARNLFKEDIKRVISLMHPRFLFFDADHVDVLGWDEACEASGRPAGQMVAKFIRDETAAAKKIDPTIQIVTCDDMLDLAPLPPADALFIKGGLGEIIDGLPKGTLILNRNHLKSADALKVIAKHGFVQVLCCSLDKSAGDPPIATIEKLAFGVPGIGGFSYFTQTDDYSHLGEFFKSALAEARAP